ncbi:MAG: IclR family transcriptional regulator [Candidatus Sedimenticola sp. PURPLELP]
MTFAPCKVAEEHTSISDEKPQRRRIQSVERALEILEVLAAAPGEVRLNQIADAMNLNVSTCHHLISTLVDRGYAAQSSQGRTYFLGNKILELSGSRMRQFNLADRVMDDLRGLNELTGETVHLAALQGSELVTLAVLDSRHPVRVVQGTAGKSNAIHATATGKAILAWLPEIEIDRILAMKGQTQFTDKTVTDRDELMAELRLVRRNGISYDDEEYQPGVFCVGAAIRDYSGATIGSFSCSMPTMRATKEHVGAVEEAVRNTARAMSKAMGTPSNTCPPKKNGVD